jgi:hypothetical protein
VVTNRARSISPPNHGITDIVASVWRTDRQTTTIPNRGLMRTTTHFPLYDCLLFPAVRDPQWVEARFGHI